MGTDGAKLPSVGLCLNASKAEARLDMATLLLGLFFVRGRIGFGLHPDSGTWTCAISVLVYPEHPFSRVGAPRCMHSASRSTDRLNITRAPTPNANLNARVSALQ